MSLNHSPQIVTNGLVLCLDAADIKSYPRTGTTWFDRSGNGNNGTLVNGPTYSNGAIVFDGTDDCITCGTSSPTSGNISVFSWVYPTAFQSIWNIIVTKWFSSGNDFHWSLKSNIGNGTNIKQNIYTTSNSDIYGTNTFTINNWYYVGFTLVNGGNLTFYKNGIIDGVTTSVSRTIQTSDLQIGDKRAIQNGLIGKIPIVNIYNKALSQSEVLQNYNAMKGRYGL